MKKMIISLSAILLTLTILLASHLFYLYVHCDFDISEFQHNFILDETYISSSADESLKKQALVILDQPFYYLKCGKQMTAFISKDQHHVIKLFNPRDYLNKKKWFSDFKKLPRLSSIKWISNAYFERKARLKRLMKRYENGFSDLREESGLEYVHLNRSTCVSKSLHLFDQHGNEHCIPLNSFPFVLQKKSDLALSCLIQLIETGKEDLAKERIVQLYNHFLIRTQKGFTDRDQTLHNNYGFIENQAIQIDLGKLKKDERLKTSFNQEMEKIFIPMARSLSSRFPQLAPFLNELIERLYLEHPTLQCTAFSMRDSQHFQEIFQSY